MQIGELASALGVSADTLRFYEKSGVLPRPPRSANGYRDYGRAELDRIRLLLDLRRLDLPLDEASRLAGWCHSGHCLETTAELPGLVGTRRAAIRDRMKSLQELDARLAALERHLTLAPLPMTGGSAACCSAAEVVSSAL